MPAQDQSHSRQKRFPYTRGDGPWPKLHDLYPDRACGDWEKTWLDNFESPYTDKVYRVQRGKHLDWEEVRDPASKNRAFYGTGISSIGLQAMYHNPAWLADSEPDLFDFTFDTAMRRYD